MRRSEQVSSARLEQVIVAEGVQRVAVHEGDLRGVLVLTATKERRPGVLVVGGSDGGVPLRSAAWLASRGYAALALAYFRYEDLPAKLEVIPLEYFEHALIWMTQRPEILGNRLAVMGTSRGGELALQLGSMFPRIGAVRAYVPANVRYPACCGGNIVPYD
jgi:dienelactone hydrolase